MQTLLCLIFLLPFFVVSQETDALKNKGKLTGQWRTYYMNTSNKGSLKDFSALATGGKIKYQFRFHEKFELGAVLYNSTNLGVQDLKVADAAMGKLSRYEEGLFDRLDLANDVVVLLGELYASYTLPKHEFKLGRMKINTPLVNPEDGRMIPTLVQGLWYKFKGSNANLLQVGILNRIAPDLQENFSGSGKVLAPTPKDGVLQA